jgi:hypothetical protein
MDLFEKILLGIVVVGFALGLVFFSKDLVRYLKIRAM